MKANICKDKLLHMQELVLAGNNLQIIPEQIAQLTSLKRLQLAGNQLTALPNVITTMDRLQVIEVLQEGVLIIFIFLTSKHFLACCLCSVMTSYMPPAYPNSAL